MQNIKLESITNWNKETKNDGSLFNEEFERINQNFREVAGVDVSPELQSSNVTVVKHNRWGQKRQVILKGKKDQSTGLSEFLTAGTEANSVKLVTGDIPLICALSGGYDEWGATEYTVKIEGDSDLASPEWSEVTGTENTETAYFLYLLLDKETKEISYRKTTSVPVYSYQKPATEFESNDQFWFDLTSFTMNQYNDQILDWDPVLAIFIGEVQIDSVETKIISYTIGTEYEFDWYEVIEGSEGEKEELFHNIGNVSISCDVYVNDEVSGERFNFEESLRYCDYQYYATGGGMGATKRIQRNTVIIGTGTHYPAYYHTSHDKVDDGEYATNAFYKVRVKRTF